MSAPSGQKGCHATIGSGLGTQGDVVRVTDAELIRAYVRDGGESAFLAIYDRHAAAMYALALRLLGGREADAADALQEAWVRIIPRLPSFRGESALRTWLCGFVVNCCRERFRAPLFEPVDDGPSESPERDLPLDLERALAGLADGYRAVLVLHDVEGYTHHEIAAALDIDEGTSKSQLSRGRRALRRRLHPGALTR
jgi:RNA polymerase sigma-70 factor (ECF subfamily)